MNRSNSLKYAIGVDLGGTFVKAALVSENGDIVFREELPIGHEASKKDILDAIESIIRSLVDQAHKTQIDISGIGIGTPGIVHDGVVLGGADNLNGWENIDLRGYYSPLFKLPIQVDNDANLMGMGELYYGAAKGCTDVICLTIGTGIGGAIIANGALYGGFMNRGTEMGHIVVEHNGPECNCGGKGCLELYASTNALIRQYAELSNVPVQDLNGRYIIEKFKEQDTNALICLQDHTEYLGHGIASLINIFAPQKVVIGGGISAAGQFYIDMIRKSASNYMMPDCGKHTAIVAAKLGNTAGSLGAAALVFNTSK